MCILTGHGLKDPEWAIAGAAHPAAVPADADGRRGRAGAVARCASPSPCRRPRRTSGPGSTASASRSTCCNEVTVDTDAAPGVEWEGEGADELPDRRHRHGVGRRSRRWPVDDRPAAAVPHARPRTGSRSSAGSGRRRPRPWRACVIASCCSTLGWETTHRRSRCSPPPPRSRGIPTTPRPRVRRVHDRDARRLRPAGSTRIPTCGRSPSCRRRASPTARGARARCRRWSPRADAVFNVAHAALAWRPSRANPRCSPRAPRPAPPGGAARARARGREVVADSVREAGRRRVRVGRRPDAPRVRPLDRSQVPDPGEGWLVMPPAVRRERVRGLGSSAERRSARRRRRCSRRSCGSSARVQRSAANSLDTIA